ncbi:MAG: YbjN domain-containing protein [Roseiflexaceae bacterium]|nr:YbjN domain-containing protein [Roseiflexaceae bacterium]
MDEFEDRGEQNSDAALTHPNSIRAFDTLGAFLEEDEWYPARAEGWHGYWVHYTGSNAEIRCFAQIRVEMEVLLIYAMSPIRAPEQLRAAVAEFVTRANYGLNIGNFELSYEDGRVRFKTSLDFEGADLTPNLIRNTIYPAVRTMNSYLPGLMKVMYAGAAPAAAIAEIEG